MGLVLVSKLLIPLVILVQRRATRRMMTRTTRTLARGWQSAPRVRPAHLLRMRQCANHTAHSTRADAEKTEDAGA